MLKKYLLVFCAIILIVFTGCSLNKAEPAVQGNKKLVEGNKTSAANCYDVIVLGGEPEGVAAAVSAARNGLSVLLVEDDYCLGGLMTLGRLNFIDMNYDKNGTLLTRGIFKEFYDAVGGTAFEISKAEEIFLTMVKEAGVTLKLNTCFTEPIVEGNTLVGLKVVENDKTGEYYAKRLIDATVDADLAVAAGVPYTVGGEDIGEKERKMGVTLIFELSGVDWQEVVCYLKSDGNRYSGANEKAAWGYGREGYSYQPRDPQIKLRGFNIARQKNGNVLVNSLIIFGVDPLDSASKKEAIERAKRELKDYIIPYVRENFAGFAGAELAGTARQLYVRESRHIIGEYRLTIDDVLENRDHWDRIAVGSYPVDLQPFSPKDSGSVLGNPDKYSIPFRCLVPKEIENLLVVGRSASYTSLAAGSARVIPVGMCEGEAAGVAAAYSIKNNISFRNMTKSKEAIKAVQERLKEQGAYLEPFEVDFPLKGHWAYEGVKTLRGLGLLKGKYNNDYGLEKKINKWLFQTIINESLKKAGRPPENYIEVSRKPNCAEVLRSVAEGFGRPVNSAEEARQVLKEAGILTEKLAPFFARNDERPATAEVIMLVANLYKIVSANSEYKSSL